jgi:hypothetical protein
MFRLTFTVQSGGLRNDVVVCWDTVPKKRAERGWVAGLSADQFFAWESRTRS